MTGIKFIGRSNLFGEFTRFDAELVRKSFSGIQMLQGSQMLRIPPGSKIVNLTLGGGAFHQSRWAACITENF